MMEHTGYLDIHTHILPGIDDGSRDWEETRRMLVAAHEQGIRTIVATPHNYPGHKQENKHIRQLCAKANEIAGEIDASMQILPGNEVFYREGIVRGIEEEHILTLAGSRYVLLEFHPESSESQVLQGIRELTENGYAPVIAHVERVNVLFGKNELRKRVLESGCYLQTNCKSVSGGRFAQRARKLRKLIEEGSIHFLGSDCHNTKERPPVMRDAIQKLSRSVSPEMIEKLTKENPEKFLRKEYI